MSENKETQIKLRMPLLAWILIAGAFATAVAAFSTSQAELGNHTREIDALKITAATAASEALQQRVLLERIDERTAEMKRQMERNRP